MAASPSKRYEHVQLPHFQASAVVALSSGAATIELTLPVERTHWFAAVEFYSEGTGTTVVQPTSGTSTFTTKTPVLPSKDEATADNVVNYANEANRQVSWQSNSNSIKVVCASIAGNGATHVRLRAMGNAS